MRIQKPQYATANFYFPNANGPDVIAELVTKENPMTPERKRKIQAFRASGYKVLVWDDEEFDTFEKIEEKICELRKLLGETNDQEFNEYKDIRRKTYMDIFEDNNF